jgi:hypothetical protein
MFEPLNLAVACPYCNIAKRDKETLTHPTVTAYPSSAASFVVVHPHFDRWEDHIDKSGIVFRPISNKGTWTVKHCKLGRFAVKYIDPTAGPLARPRRCHPRPRIRGVSSCRAGRPQPCFRK